VCPAPVATLKDFSDANWSRYTRNSGPDETLEAHCVALANWIPLTRPFPIFRRGGTVPEDAEGACGRRAGGACPAPAATLPPGIGGWGLGIRVPGS
jgi:hypothetical protein